MMPSSVQMLQRLSTPASLQSDRLYNTQSNGNGSRHSRTHFLRRLYATTSACERHSHDASTRAHDASLQFDHLYNTQSNDDGNRHSRTHFLRLLYTTTFACERHSHDASTRAHDAPQIRAQLPGPQTPQQQAAVCAFSSPLANVLPWAEPPTQPHIQHTLNLPDTFMRSNATTQVQARLHLEQRHNKQTDHPVISSNKRTASA